MHQEELKFETKLNISGASVEIPTHKEIELFK